MVFAGGKDGPRMPGSGPYDQRPCLNLLRMDSFHSLNSQEEPDLWKDVESQNGGLGAEQADLMAP